MTQFGAAALVALGWVARVIGVGRPMALGQAPHGNGGPRSVLVSMGFTVSLVLVSSVFLMSLGYPYTTDFQDQPNRISQTVSSGCIPLYTHCIPQIPSQMTGLYGLYGLYTP